MTRQERLLRLERQQPNTAATASQIERDGVLFTQRIDAPGDRFEPADAELSEDALRGMNAAQHWAWLARFGDGTANTGTLAAICAEHGVSLPLFRDSLEKNDDACS